MLRRWIAALLLAVPGATHGLSLRAMSPAELARAAEAVVIADVEREGFIEADTGALVERLRLEVRETWKGEARASRTLLQWVSHGGRTVAGLQGLLPGKRYLLFLPPASARPVLPATVGGAQGAIELVAGPGGCVVPRGLDAMHVPPASSPTMRPGAGVVLRPAPSAGPPRDPCAALSEWRRVVAEAL